MEQINRATNLRLNNSDVQIASCDGFNMLQINIRGMNNFEKLDAFCIFLHNLEVTIDVLVVEETWIKESRSNFYNIPGYQSTYSCRRNSAGGVAVFVRDGLNFSVKANATDDGYHHVGVEIQTSPSVTVYGIYRPPGYDISRFISHMELILSSLDSKQPCFILGDMNIAINNENCRMAQQYLQMLSSYNMIVTNTHVTRPSSSNILDHVVCQADKSERITNYTINCSLSDHCYVLTKFNKKMRKEDRILTKTIVNYRHVNSNFQSFLQTTDFGSLQPQDRLQLITDRYSQLILSFSSTFSVRVKTKTNVCPWLNFDVWKLGKISNNLFQKWKRDRMNENLKRLLAHANKKLADTKRRAKSAYYQRMFSSNNPKYLWSKINELMGNKSGKKKQLILEANGVETDVPASVGDIFNTFFSSIGDNLASTLVSDGNINKFGTMTISNTSMFLRPTTQVEVSNIISGLDASKATGIDGFPVGALKRHSVLLSSILCDCFNDSISLGIYPSGLKQALVYPVFKNGNPKKATNYRPISVLPSINKVFEKLLCSRLNNFMHTTGLLFQHQFGFRQGSSTEVAVLELVDDISRSVDKKMSAAAVFLDLSKAFDTINHRILLKKLEAYGIRGVANQFLESYLKDRRQQVVIDGIKSTPSTINCGVPQGSNIGPLLFLIYVNDIAKLNLKGQLRLFADDTAISYEAKTVSELYRDMSHDLKLIMQYLENNLLALNLQKTKMMLFGKRETLDATMGLVINGATIEEVDRFKYLGVWIDNRLKWDVHIRETVASCSSLCGILRRLAPYVPRHVLLKMYYAFIHSRYQYGIAAWGTSCHTYLKEMQVQQNRCVKAVYNLPFLQPTNTLYNTENNILPVLGLFTFQIGITMFKVVNNFNLHHNWIFSGARHQHQTRYAHMLQQSGFRSEVGRRRFINMGPNIFNQLPEYIKNSNSILEFKRCLKSYIKDNVNNYIIP